MRVTATSPAQLGSDLTGEVEALGCRRIRHSRRDQVFWVTNPRFIGAYDKSAVASAGMLAKKPASLSFIEAASFPA